MSATKVQKLIKDSNAQFVDLRFTDTIGKEQHVTIPTHQVDAAFFKEGKMFDGSSIAGWKGINESDMILMPDTSTGVVIHLWMKSPLICVATLSSRQQCKATNVILALSLAALKPI